MFQQRRFERSKQPTTTTTANTWQTNEIVQRSNSNEIIDIERNSFVADVRCQWANNPDIDANAKTQRKQTKIEFIHCKSSLISFSKLLFFCFFSPERKTKRKIKPIDLDTAEQYQLNKDFCTKKARTVLTENGKRNTWFYSTTVESFIIHRYTTMKTILMARKSFSSEQQSKFLVRTSHETLSERETTRYQPSIQRKSKRRARRNDTVVRREFQGWIHRRRNLNRTTTATMMTAMRMFSPSFPWTNNGSSKLRRTKNATNGFNRSNNRFYTVCRTSNLRKQLEPRKTAARRSRIRRPFSR